MGTYFLSLERVIKSCLEISKGFICTLGLVPVVYEVSHATFCALCRVPSSTLTTVAKTLCADQRYFEFRNRYGRYGDGVETVSVRRRCRNGVGTVAVSKRSRLSASRRTLQNRTGKCRETVSVFSKHRIKLHTQSFLQSAASRCLSVVCSRLGSFVIPTNT